MPAVPRSGDDVRARLRDLARDVFAFDLDAYLAAFGRELWGVTLRGHSAPYGPLFGEPNVERLAAMPYVDSEAGYCADVGHYLPGVAADVFLVKPDRLLEGEFEFDALLVHELAHLLCDPDLRELPMIAPEPPTSGFVRRLKNFVPDDWHHTERFFAIFVAGCRRLGELSGRSTLDTIAAGLRHEQWFDAEYLAQHCAD
ncbi:MAG TPA: hypothetical protein VEK11_24430 [Thermoanaerobaculia bacterium]|nr:hypothetical protein [Thermoanaerobaculia bacterium]